MNLQRSSLDEIRIQIQENIDIAEKLMEESIELILKAGDRLISTFRKRNKLLLCGNGGSAADSQHIAAEFVNRFRKERDSLPAIALTTDSSILTSISNDYDYRYCFSKQVKAIGQKGDVLMGISTSGMARNVIEAVKIAKSIGIYTIGLTGKSGGRLMDFVDLCIRVPSNDTPRIQEAHILIGHLLCDIVERQFEP